MSSSINVTTLTQSNIEDLQRQATQVAHHAYAPYSKFRVGAALLLTNGAVITGCNVENASYRLTTCAEQSAITAAVSLHGPSIRIRAIVIANLNGEACQPCGACRQTIHEFSTAETTVLFPTQDSIITEAKIADLLPAAFLLNS